MFCNLFLQQNKLRCVHKCTRVYFDIFKEYPLMICSLKTFGISLQLGI